MDDRIAVLIRQRSVKCTLRKQPAALTAWWYEAMAIYSALWTRPDKNDQPLRSILTEIFTLLKFVALPNNPERKKAQIDTKWPGLKERINVL